MALHCLPSAVANTRTTDGCDSSNRDVAVHGTSCRVLMSVTWNGAAAQQNEILSKEIPQGPQVSVLKA